MVMKSVCFDTMGCSNTQLVNLMYTDIFEPTVRKDSFVIESLYNFACACVLTGNIVNWSYFYSQANHFASLMQFVFFIQSQTRFN